MQMAFSKTFFRQLTCSVVNLKELHIFNHGVSNRAVHHNNAVCLLGVPDKCVHIGLGNRARFA